MTKFVKIASVIVLAATLAACSTAGAKDSSVKSADGTFRHAQTK